MEWKECAHSLAFREENITRVTQDIFKDCHALPRNDMYGREEVFITEYRSTYEVVVNAGVAF
eukprot:1816688-Prorocentrum_lima.AAC.1